MGGGKGGEGGGERGSFDAAETMDLSEDGEYSVAQEQQGVQQDPKPAEKDVGAGDAGKQYTMADAGTSRAMEVSLDEYEIVYVKDNVSVHPTQQANGRISGRLRLIKQGPSLFMTWIPYTQGGANRDLSATLDANNAKNRSKAADRDRNLYTIRAVSLAEMRSIRRHTPPLGWQYIIIVLQSGLAFPPLYFHNGGVREFLNTLKSHAILVRSADDANVYLVNDIQDPLQKSLTSLDLLPPAPLSPAFPKEARESTQKQVELPVVVAGADSTRPVKSSMIQSGHRQREPNRDISLHVLEKFSLVTRFARETTAQLFGNESRMLGGSDSFDHGPAPRPLEISTAMLPLPVPELKEQESPLPPPSPQPPSADEASDARFERNDQKNADEHASTNVGTFELVDGTQNESPALVWGRARPPPLEIDEWRSFLDGEGRVLDPKALKRRIFHGGLEPSLRSEVWKFLLGYFQFDSTYAEREYQMVHKREEYDILKSQWQSVSDEQAKRFAKYRERKHRVEKDVVRTDRTLPFYEGDDNPNVTTLRDILVTYSFYNFDLGYCQGMSDLLSPILYIVKDESESFWCFASLMERMAPNFHRDQNGMHSQLLALSKLVQLLDGPLHDYFKQADCLNYFFCFRWILIQFKREFDYENVMRLWEVLWSHYISEHFHLYMCVALLKRHRRKIMDEQMEFDTLLKFINELSGQIPLESTLRDAEALCLFAGDRGAACIPPGTPPALPTIDQTQQ